MSLFAIGDTHLSLSCDKPMDVFRGWSDYVSRLESNWNRIVGENDTVLIAGDISWAMKLADVKADLQFINGLNGKKIIMKGNHDYWWETMAKMNRFLDSEGLSTISFLFNNAFSVGGVSVAGTRGWFCDDSPEKDRLVLRREAGRLSASIKAARELSDDVIVFLHYPPVSQTQRCDEIMQVLTENSVRECYFGHLHGAVPPENASFVSDGISFELISADHLEFVPKLIRRI